MVTIRMVLMLLVAGIFVLLVALSSITDHKTETQLGYPKLGESLQDVRFLLSIGENILALRCYRRIYRCSLRVAKEAVEQLPEYQAVSNPIFKKKP